MEDYNKLIERHNNLWNQIRDDELCKRVKRKDVEELVTDMWKFVKEDHPSEQKTMFWPMGMIESWKFILDDSDPEKSFKFADDE